MTRELDQFSIQSSPVLAVEEPQYATLATQPLATYIDKEVRSAGHPRIPSVYYGRVSASFADRPYAAVRPAKQPRVEALSQ